jgi:hypothetical protein
LHQGTWRDPVTAALFTIEHSLRGVEQILIFLVGKIEEVRSERDVLTSAQISSEQETRL